MHFKDNRALLYFNTSDKSPFMMHEMHDAGWNIKLTNDISEATNIISRYSPQVAIAQFGDLNGSVATPVESFFHHADQVKWVALVPKECINKRQIKQIVSESFYDFHTLPPAPSKLLTTLGHAYGMASMRLDGTHSLRSALTEHEPTSSEDEMVGSSLQMLDLFKNIRKVADVDAPVMITGESGTGKELAALALHERSSRKNMPFIAVNCGALPSGLIQSELFGHEKGAFTGASQRKIGRIESAAGGTVFLDEIGDLPLELQANLLRFLQEKTIERVGGTTQITVDVRVLAATHVNLEVAVKEGRFREDLYYRLNVLNIKTPALRDRQGDVELMAKYFFEKFSHEKRRNVKGFSPTALQVMNQYTWPGNVREMINRIRRAMVMCERRLITPDDLDLDRRDGERMVTTLENARNSAEMDAIRNALQQNNNNLTVASRELGVSRVTLYRLIQKYGLKFKQESLID
ncbi:transcriptional regulatory protein ZraR [mine drainage metagenome]|uniref:Transcriptional regulatory protein ZraR n=1 Tax=mine drainage metagenome TaxID=410659 RepID=A0A1J5RG92_9ZZZZ